MIPNPDVLFKVEYLRNGTRYVVTLKYVLLIWNYTHPTQGCDF